MIKKDISMVYKDILMITLCSDFLFVCFKN